MLASRRRELDYCGLPRKVVPVPLVERARGTSTLIIKGGMWGVGGHAGMGDVGCGRWGEALASTMLDVECGWARLHV